MPTLDTGNDKDSDVTREQVIQHLMAHPGFLDENPELLTFLTPPTYQSEEGGVVNMTRFMVDRLRKEVEKVQRQFGELVFSARDNLSAQAQVHEAVIQLLRSATIEDLLSITCVDLQAVFDVDVVQLCLETDIGPREYLPEEHALSGMTFLKPGMVDAILGKNESIILGASGAAISQIFGDAAGLVGSYALVRLHLDHPHRNGLLAFGVRNPERFHSGQATDLLEFLGAIMELCLDRCLQKTGK